MKSRSIQLRRGGFSLIELIGVLTVMSILATVLTPTAIQQIDIALARTETLRLEALAKGFRDAVVRNARIPDENGWVSFLAAELDWPAEDIHINLRCSPRVYLIDASMQIGPGGGGLPYTQTTAGSIKPFNARVMVLSNLDPTKSLPVTSGVLDSASFEEIWNTRDDDVPQSWAGRWRESGAPLDLKIQRIHLGSLFHQVILNSPTLPRAFLAVGNGATTCIPGSGISVYYIEGTTLKLFDSDENLEVSQIVHKPVSFTYEDSAWNGRVFRGDCSNDDGIYLAHELFLQSGTATAVQTSEFASALTHYFLCYRDWAASGFLDDLSPSYIALEKAEANLRQAGSELLPATP